MHWQWRTKTPSVKAALKSGRCVHCHPVEAQSIFFSIICLQIIAKRHLPRSRIDHYKHQPSAGLLNNSFDLLIRHWFFFCSSLVLCSIFLPLIETVQILFLYCSWAAKDPPCKNRHFFDNDIYHWCTLYESLWQCDRASVFTQCACIYTVYVHNEVIPTQEHFSYSWHSSPVTLKSQPLYTWCYVVINVSKLTTQICMK